MKKMLFIYNPFAGKAIVQKDLNLILNFYTSKGYLVTVYPTQCAGDGYDFMWHMQEEFDLVVVCGGDGTVNEVVSGMTAAERKYPLGYLPMGSTNDFASTIGVDGELEHALDISVSGRMTALDLGRLNEKYFLYVAAFGLFTDIPYSTSQSLKNNIGYLAYILQGVRALTDLKTIHLKIQTPEICLEDDYCVGIVSNSLSVSGFKNPVSGVTQLNDGLLEALLIKMPQNIFELNGIVTTLLAGGTNHPKIETLQFSEMQIHAEALSWTIDGEYGGTYDDSVISVQPRKLKMRIYDDGNLQEKLMLPENSEELPKEDGSYDPE